MRLASAPTKFIFSHRVSREVVHAAVHSGVHRVVHFLLKLRAKGEGRYAGLWGWFGHRAVHFFRSIFGWICEGFGRVSSIVFELEVGGKFGFR